MLYTSTTRRPTVLVIEQVTHECGQLEAMFLSHAFDVWAATTIADTLTYAAGLPDLIVLDGDLPAIGETVYRALMYNAVFAAIPLLILSDETSRDTYDDRALPKHVAPAFLVAHARALIQAGRAEQCSQVIVAQLADAVVLLAADGTALSANVSIDALLGYAPATEHATVFGSLGPAANEQIATLVQQVLTTPGESVETRLRVTHRDGRTLWFAFRLTNLLHDPAVGALMATMRDATAAVASEQAARATTIAYILNQLQPVLDAMSDGVIIAEPTRTVRLWNAAALHMQGYADMADAHARLSPLTETLFLSYEDGTVVPYAEWPINRLFRGETIANLKLGIQRSDADINLVARLDGVPIRWQDGRIAMIVLLLRDVTRHERAVRVVPTTRVTDSQALYRLQAIVNSMSDGLIVFDTSGFVVTANAAALQMWGYTAIAESRQSIRMFAHTFKIFAASGEVLSFDEWPTVRALRGEPIHDEYVRVQRLDTGHERVLHMSSTFLQNSDFQLDLVVITMHDITERERAEQHAREAQQRLKHVVSSSPAILFITAVQDNKLRANIWVSENIQQIFGYDVGDAYPPGWWWARVHPDDVERLRALLDETLLSHGHVSYEYQFRHRNGAYRWSRDDIRLVYDSTGTPIEAVGSWSDITESKRLQEQYQQAQKMETIGRLVAGVAHDFNNMITIINASASMLLQSLSSSSEARELIHEIQHAGMRAEQLTRQLLTVNRQQVLTPQIFDVNALVTNAESMLRRILGDTIQLVVKLTSNSLFVQADHGQIDQVLINLCMNARDAMADGGQLTVETRTVEMPAEREAHSEVQRGSYIVMVVRDTGAGMSRAVMDRMFEPFFTTKAVGKGTGLGLATAHSIVKQAGGSIKVRSVVTEGTVFEVYLPRVVRAQNALVKRDPFLASLRGSETILVVEDEARVCAITQRILAEKGYTVLAAAGLAEALHLIETHTSAIDLLITDVVLPDVGGRELAERVRERLPHVRLLYTSGYTDDAVIRRGVLFNTVNFLQKPFTADALARKVRDVLDADA